MNCQCWNTLVHTPASLHICLVFFTLLYGHFFLIRYDKRNHSYCLTFPEVGNSNQDSSLRKLQWVISVRYCFHNCYIKTELHEPKWNPYQSLIQWVSTNMQSVQLKYWFSDKARCLCNLLSLSAYTMWPTLSNK